MQSSIGTKNIEKMFFNEYKFSHRQFEEKMRMEIDECKYHEGNKTNLVAVWKPRAVWSYLAANGIDNLALFSHNNHFLCIIIISGIIEYY